ncbi:hypothetical protein K438DRAFT_1783118 [Mycena galopus ATCC 62051]|nr:hypothetical protein K438DRAFT_1783118 [Mycena galopus ATCC 62051]
MASEDVPMTNTNVPSSLFTFTFPFTPRFGWNVPPPSQNTPPFASTSPPPPSGQGAPPSGSNLPPPPSRDQGPSGQGAPPSGSNPPPPPSGQGAPPSGSNPPPPPSRDQGGRPSGQSSRDRPSSRSHPAPEDPAAAGDKRKQPHDAPGPHARRRTGTVPNPGSPPKRPRTDDAPNSKTPANPNKSAKKSAKPKRGPKNWGIPRTAVPDTAVGLQSVESPFAPPNGPPLSISCADPSPANIVAGFEQRFSSPEDLDGHLNSILAAAIPPTNSVYEQVAAFLSTAKAMTSQTATDAARVGDHHLRSMFNAIANAGLQVFAPDVFGNPESLYNLAHEHVAIHSFRAIASLFAYSSIYSIDLSLIKDDHLLRRFYRSFMYGRMKSQAGKEERRPGRVGVDIVLNNIYRRRDEMKAFRTTQIADDCFMNKTVALLAAENDCHSDDEELADGTGFMVHEKPGRDSAVSAFFGVLTARRETTLSQQRKKGSWRRRIRRRGLPPSDLSHVRPTNVPIDYFSPQFFNDLSVRDRAIYMNNGVALPTAEHCQTWADIAKWKGLAKAEFMAKYGDAKRALYVLLTEAELAELDDDSMDSMDDD